MKIYVASSWRNESQPEVIKTLKQKGFDVYDFRNPTDKDHGFHWSDIDPNWQNWTIEKYRKCLQHSIAERGFNSDITAMNECDVFIGVMPFGRSASMEMGWGAGQGKITILLISDTEPELMVKMFNHICINMDEVLKALDREIEKSDEKRISCNWSNETGGCGFS